MGKSNENYTKAAEAYEKAYNQYAGDAGIQKSVKFAEDEANKQSAMAGAKAGAQAQQQARTAGMSKAAAADMAASNAAAATRDSYTGLYGGSRDASLANNQAAIGSRQQNINTAQSQDQAEYDRTWGTIGGIGSMVGGILSDENAKINVTKLNYAKNVADSVAKGAQIATKQPVSNETKSTTIDYNSLLKKYQGKKEEETDGQQ